MIPTLSIIRQTMTERNMASIRKEILTTASPADAWAALRDVGALHHRLVPGFVVDTRLEPGARIVTFGNGMVVKELIVDIDDRARRLAWAAVGGLLTHHNASAQVFPHGERGSCIVWTADLLPDDLKGIYILDSLDFFRHIHPIDKGLHDVQEHDFDLPAFRDVPGPRNGPDLS
jgi:hypothetical protein